MDASLFTHQLHALKPRWDSVPGWKRKLLYAATALGLVGVGTDGYESLTADEKPAVRAEPVSPSMRSDLAGAKPQLRAVPVEAGATSSFTWGGAGGRLGFSFAIAFLAALALRWFIKTTLTLAGLAAAGVAVLVHYDVIDASHIGNATEWAESLGPWLSRQTDSATAFLKGHLPSGAAGGAGLFLGLRK